MSRLALGVDSDSGWLGAQRPNTEGELLFSSERGDILHSASLIKISEFLVLGIHDISMGALVSAQIPGLDLR